MKKRIGIIIVFLIIVLNHFYQLHNTDENQVSYDNIDNIEMEEAVEFSYTNQEIVQSIVARDDYFNKINIYLDPVENKYDASQYVTMYLSVSLKDEAGKVIESYKYEKVFINGNAALSFRFPTIKNSKGKKYYLYIESYRENDLPIKVIPNDSADYNMYVDSELNENKLILITEYETNKINNLFYIISLFIIIIFILLFLFFDKKGIHLPIHKQYFILAIVLSLLMIFTSPLYVGNDEISHLGRAYELSNGRLISHTINDWPQTEFPVKLANIEYYNYLDIPLKLESIKGNNSFIYLNMEYTSVYSPISYIPQVIGLWISRLFSFSAFLWPYVCRIFQALACILCVYYAIKIIPFGKNVVFFIALLPTFLKATSLISADSLLVSFSLLFIAKILQIIYDKKELTKEDYIVLTLMAIIISISKLVYFPLSFLVFLIPFKLKKERKPLLKKSVKIIILALLITLLWNGIASLKLTSGQGVNVFYYIRHYLRNPLDFAQITIYTFYNELGNFISDVFGGENNWVSTTIFDSTIFPLFFLGGYVYLIFYGENKLSLKDKKFIGCILICTYLLISSSLLLTCTPIYNKEIIGIQGRYFIAFLLPIYLIFAKEKKEKEVSNFSLILIVIYFAYFLRYIYFFL